MNGDENEKMKMSFRLIDDKNKGYFIKEDLQMMIKSIVNSWAAITQTTLTKEMLSKVDKQINHIFKVMDIKKQEKVEEQDFCLSLQKYPDLLEIFDFLNKGVTDTVVHNDNRSRELQIAKELAHIEKFLESLTLYLTGETTQFYEINLINQDHIHQKIDFCKKEVNNRVPSFQEIQKKLYPFSSQQNENIQNGEESINLNFEKGIDVSNQTYHQSNFILHNQKQSINSDKHQLKFVNKQKSNDNNNIQIKNDHLKNVSNSISMDIKNKQNENMHYLQTEQDQLQHHSKNPSNLSECGSGEKDQFDDHFYNFNMIDMHKNIQQQFEEENNINKNKNIYYQEGFDSPQKSQKNSQESNNNSQQNATFQPIIKNENSLSHQEQIQTAQQSSSHRINQQQQRSSSVMNGDSAHKQNILFQSPTLGIISGEGQKNNYINIHKRNFSSQSNSDNDFQTAQFVSSLPNQQYLLQNLQSSKHPDYVIEGSFQESTTIYPNKNNNNFDQNLKNLSVSNTSIQQFQNKVGASFQMPLKDRSQNLDYPQKLRQYQFVNKGNSISTTDQQTNNFNSIGQLNNFSFMHNHPQSQNTSQTHSQQTLQSPILNYDEEAILKKYESVMCADCICRVTQKFKHDKLKEFRKLSVPVVQQKVQMNQQQQINQNYHSIKQIQYLQSKTFPHTSTNSQISFNENNYFLDPSNHQLRTKLDRIAQKFLGDIDEIESCNLGSDDDEYKKKNNQRQQPQTPMQNPFQVMDPVSINPKRGDSGLFTSGISNKEIQKGQAIKYNQNMKYQYSSSSNANEIIPIDSQIKAKEYEQNVIASVQKQQADDLTNRIIRFDDTDYSRLNSPNQQLSPSISNLASFYEQKAETYIPGSKKSSIYIQQGNNTKPTINTASSTQRQNSIQGYSLKFPNNHKNYTKSSTAEIVRQTSQSVGNAIDNKMHQQIKKTNDTNVILKQRQQNESPILQTEDIQIEVSANAQRVGNKFIQSEVNIKEVCSNQQLNDQNVNNNNIYSGTNNDINTNQIIDPTHYVYVESYNTNSKNVQSSSSQIKTKNSNQLISHPVQSSSYNNRRIINASNLKSQRDMIETESENIQYNAHTPTTFLNKIEQEQMTSSLSNEVNKLQFGSKNQIDKTPTAVMISKDNIFLHIQNQKNNDTQNENQEEYLGSSDNLLEQQKIEYPIKLSQLQDKKIKKLIQERKQDFKYQEDAVYMNPNNNIPKISQMLLQSGNQEKASQYLYANQTDKNNSQTPTKIELNGFNRKEDHNIDTGHNMKYKEENADDLINKLNYISPRHNIYSASKLNKNSYNPQSLRSSQPIDIFKVQSTILNTSKANNLFQNNLHNIQSQENKQTDHSQVNFIQQIMEMNADELKKRAVNIFFYAKEICLFVQTIKKSIESNLNARLSEKQSSNIYIGQGRQKSLDNKLQSFSKLQAAASPLHSKQPMVAQSMQGRLPHQLNQSVIINNKTPPLQPIFNNNNEEENIRISTIYNIQKKQPRQKEPRKPKLMVFFGHQNWNLVVNMMMGIQMSVQSAASNIILNENNQMPDLQNRDFKVKYLFELLPRKDNLEKEWSYKVCKFQDYAPNVFQRIRMLYNITDEQYLKSLGPNQLFNLGNGGLNSFSQLTSTGKSGSFFYFTADGLFTLKTVSRTEFHHLKNILKNYYEHLKENRNSLIIKFFGLHKIKIRMKKSTKVEIVYIVIMANVFHTTKLIHERYDLKGSTYGRTTKVKTQGVTMKDLDFLEKKTKIQAKFDEYEEFMNVVKKDAKFFEENNIIDYSMLVGVHNNSLSNLNPEQSDQVSQTIKDQFSRVQQHRDFKLTKDISSFYSRDNRIYYLFGIIDILTCFNAKKKFEYLAKRIAFGPNISAIPPSQYSQRFVKFMDDMFDEDSKVPQELKQ